MIRRNFRRAAAALASAPVMRAAAAPADAIPPWTKTQGAPIAEDHYGVPSPFEAHVMRRPREKLLFDTAGSIVTPLQDLDGIITPNGLHYIRSHAGTPAIDPDQHRLMIHGMVDRPLSFSMEDLMRFPSISAVHFLECSGNTALYKEANIKPGWTVQDTHGLLSFAEWTGVRLADVLAEAGVQPGARLPRRRRRTPDLPIDPPNRRQRHADDTERGADGRQLLALCHDAAGLYPSGNAVQRAAIAQPGPGLCGDRLRAAPQRHCAGGRDDGCGEFAEGDDAEQRRLRAGG